MRGFSSKNIKYYLLLGSILSLFLTSLSDATTLSGNKLLFKATGVLPEKSIEKLKQKPKYSFPEGESKVRSGTTILTGKNKPKVKPLSKIGKRKIKEGEIIVKYKKDKFNLASTNGRSLAGNLENKKALRQLGKIERSNIKLLKSENKTTQELIAELQNDPNVESVEANYIRDLSYLPTDPLFLDQWSLDNIGQGGGTVGADIDVEDAWDIELDNSEEVIVAVIDTGVRYSHEDLAGNMWDGSAECYDENNDLIPGGCPNHGWDFADDDNNPYDSEMMIGGANVQGHGTAVAGVIAARQGNSKGISGISRYNKVKIMALRFGLDTFSEVKAINFAKNNGAQVINASFTGSYSSAEETAINNFSGIFVAAAGNGGSDNIGDDNDVDSLAPCALDLDNIICVAATDRDDELTYFSNYGLETVDLGAPGIYIDTISVDGDTNYELRSGTSFSSPVVAATVALTISQFPTETLANIRTKVINAGDTQPTLDGKTVSGKRLSLAGSLTAGVATCAPPGPGDWVVAESCILGANTTIAGNVQVNAGVVLEIPAGLNLYIDLNTNNLTVKHGGGVLVKHGGNVRQSP